MYACMYAYICMYTHRISQKYNYSIMFLQAPLLYSHKFDIIFAHFERLAKLCTWKSLDCSVALGDVKWGSADFGLFPSSRGETLTLWALGWWCMRWGWEQAGGGIEHIQSHLVHTVRTWAIACRPVHTGLLGRRHIANATRTYVSRVGLCSEGLLSTQHKGARRTAGGAGTYAH